MSISHVKLEKARILGQIQKSYAILVIAECCHLFNVLPCIHIVTPKSFHANTFFTYPPHRDGHILELYEN